MTYEFELECEAQGLTPVCGVDAAGRGPLAGPVFAAAVILPPGLENAGLNDSKKLSEKKRDALFDLICEKALAYGVASASVEEIDALNILNASLLAMRRAVEGLAIPPAIALIDGNRAPQLAIPAVPIVKGDARSISIAAASILAKVSRDRFMSALDRDYPEYQFAKHKGYPTALHYEMIKTHGISPVHRKTFLKTLSNH